MKPLNIFLFAISFIVSIDTYSEIKNGYKRELQIAEVSIKNLDSLLLTMNDENQMKIIVKSIQHEIISPLRLINIQQGKVKI